MDQNWGCCHNVWFLKMKLLVTKSVWYSLCLWPSHFTWFSILLTPCGKLFIPLSFTFSPNTFQDLSFVCRYTFYCLYFSYSSFLNIIYTYYFISHLWSSDHHVCFLFLYFWHVLYTFYILVAISLPLFYSCFTYSCSKIYLIILFIHLLFLTFYTYFIIS